MRSPGHASPGPARDGSAHLRRSEALSAVRRLRQPRYHRVGGGGWLYGAYKWGKAPIVSVGASAVYQSQALKNAFGNLADEKIFSADVYVKLPPGRGRGTRVGGDGYLNRNGSGSANTGVGFFADVGYRFTFVAPYVSYSYFNSDDCSGLTLSPAQTTTCNATIHTADSRNFKAGLNFFFNKNLNHVNLEFQVNHGMSGFGPQSITVANAGYVPAGINNTLRISSQKSFLAHWNVLF